MYLRMRNIIARDIILHNNSDENHKFTHSLSGLLKGL
jgi:hypothetical protein